MKRIFVVIIIICIGLNLLLIPNYASAASAQGEDFSWGIIQNKAQDFIKEGNKGNKDFNAAGLVSDIANILTTIGVVIVLGGLLIMGIKYMIATPDEAAKLKTKLVGLAISGVVIVGAYGIWKLVANFLFSIT